MSEVPAPAPLTKDAGPTDQRAPRPAPSTVVPPQGLAIGNLLEVWAVEVADDSGHDDGDDDNEPDGGGSSSTANKATGSHPPPQPIMQQQWQSSSGRGSGRRRRIDYRPRLVSSVGTSALGVVRASTVLEMWAECQHAAAAAVGDVAAAGAGVARGAYG